jgi:hypothetical protein
MSDRIVEVRAPVARPLHWLEVFIVVMEVILVEYKFN